MTLESWSYPLTEAAVNMWEKIAGFMPRVIMTLIVVLVCLALIRVLGKALVVALQKLGFDKLCDSIGLASGMKAAGMSMTPAQALVGLIRAFLILLVILSAAETLGLERVSAVVDDFVLYLPKMLGAVAVIVGGMFIGHHLKRSIDHAMKHMGVDYAKAISQVVYGVVLLITASLAINQLEIATGLFDVFFGIVLGSIGLAVAISFGLGTREVSSQLISGVYLREQLIPGETIKVEDNEGIILAVGTVNTLVQVGEEIHRIPNAQLIKTSFSTRSDD
ncbi:MAG: hypothetical protein COA68_00575 [Oceanobacter sp.]|jgi:fumarate reductase subunit D|nr:MAG: hypothetical protein COA68_00575 [Oceanobacter sp.]